MFRSVSLTCILLLFHCALSLEAHNNIFKDVEVDTGRVRGFLAEDGDYYAFLGIPYAAPPIEGRRFKAPLPPAPWNDVLVANRTVICPQRGMGHEDCLIVNVFTPTKIFNGPLPVLVYIHGGSFLLGSGQTKGAEPLIKQNIIVVTINYRLGALGFLCLGMEEAPGNAGMKDQVAALKWVNSNIDKFGGDPNQVTIYGMSAGGSSVELLVASKMAKGLFHKAIVESGAASAVWSIDGDPIKTATDLAQALDFPKKTKNVYKQVDYYRKKPAKELSEINYEYYQNLTDGSFGFVPCLERKMFGKEPFMTKSPNDNLTRGDYNKVPMMFVFTPLEGLFLRSSEYYELNYKDRMNSNFGDFMPADLTFDTKEIRDTVTENVKKFYFGTETVGEKSLMQYLNYFGDHLVLHGLLNSAVVHSKHNDVVYMLEFAYKGKLGSYEKFYEHINTAGHGDAIKYTILNKPIEDKNDKVIADRMTKIVANFVKFANPLPNRTDLLPIHWPAVKPDTIAYLRMDQDLQVLEEPFWERKIFWDKLYEMYRREIKAVDPGLLWL